MMSEWFLPYLMKMVGKPYKIGGDDPVGGFDCSGLACEMARMAGLVPYNFRVNAQGLWNRCTGVWKAIPGEKPGSFAFYGTGPTGITHVGICLDGEFMVEAGGGDFATDTLAEAEARNAFVRIRPIRYRKDYIGAFNPFIV